MGSDPKRPLKSSHEKRGFWTGRFRIRSRNQFWFLWYGFLETHLSTTYGFTHAKIKKSIFNLEILEFVGDIGLILNDIQSWFYSANKI